MLNAQELGEYITTHFTRTLFRLEVLDRYEVASDGNDFGRYLRGESAPDEARKQPWLDHLRSERARGLFRHRVHVVRGPLGDYLRYECEWGYLPNSAAGEGIRILDLAERAEPPDLIKHDFWLVDERSVLSMRYAEDGHFLGAEELDSGDVGYYRAARDSAWNAAQDFTEYWATHPQYWRSNVNTGSS